MVKKSTPPSARAVKRAVAAAVAAREVQLRKEQEAVDELAQFKQFNGRAMSAGEKLADWALRLGFDEPVFTLRAHDITAPNQVRRWAAAAAELDAPAEKIGDAMRTAARMERWQRAHGCKVPD